MVEIDRDKLLRDAHRLLRHNEFQGGAFHCPECGEYSSAHGGRGHTMGCAWDSVLARLRVVALLRRKKR